MKLVIFGGTTEGRELSLRMAEEGARVTVCVATDYGGETQDAHPNLTTRVGPLSPEEKQTLLRDADLCVDATHPYAECITHSVREACAEAGTPYLRLLREESALEGALLFDGANAAAAYLEQTEGNILLTTGTKELAAFSHIDPDRLFPRVLPTHAALDECERLHIPHRNIIAMQGPFTRELNEALMRQLRIAYLVTKDGGAPGGFPEKAAAAKAVGAQLLVLRRPAEAGSSFAEILALCREKLGER